MKKITHKSGRKFVKILNIPITSTSGEQVLAFVRDSLTRGYQFLITTPNPEIVLAAQKDEQLARALSTSDLALPDGVGLRYAAKFLEGKDLTVVPGRKLFWELLSLANKKGWRVFLFGGGAGVAGEAAKNLNQSFPSVKIHFLSGPKYDNEANPVTKSDERMHEECLAQINVFNPQLLFVALGAPKQEKWLVKNLPKLKVGGAMVVGRTLDWVAGTSRVSPNWLTDLGLEWFWRLITGSTNIKRIANAVVVFPWKVLLSKLNERKR